MKFFGNFGMGYTAPSNEGYTNETTQTSSNNYSKETSSTNHCYFEKKGEVNDIRRAFKGLMEKVSYTNEDLQEALKKVLAVMTLGVDLSSIFTEVLMFSYTNDVISKKMIYLYLTMYSENNEELAIMALNTFLKDCNNSDPKIRGLALRTLCSLKIPSALEYIQQRVIEMLDDRDAYVRKIAVMGILKLYYLNNSFFEEHRLMDRLYTYLKDPNKSVVACAIHALEEIMYEEGGMAINSKIIAYLMNRFGDFDNFGKNTIVNLIQRYRPKNEDEMFNVMNLLEDNLRKSNVSLTISIISVFIHFTSALPNIFSQVLERITPNLISLACSTESEELFVVLTHLLVLVKSSAKQFVSKDYKLFYCKASDENYNSKLKIEILTELANRENINDIIEEFSEYAGEKNVTFSRLAIRGLSNLLRKFPDKSVVILKRLLIYVKLGKKELVFTILNSIKDIINVLPEFPDDLINVLESAVSDESDETSLISLIYILAQIPTKVKSAPYIVESILELIVDQRKPYTRDLMLNMLNCLIRLFVKRPGEVLPILSRFFQYLFESENPYSDDIDLIERAIFYYNLLKSDVNSVAELVDDKLSMPKAVDGDAEMLKVR
jgi:AP-4 complex subunit beta-1